jgi:hypothetical protein
MYNVNNLSLIIGATRICMFLRFVISCNVLWKSIKMVESTWSIISYCWNLACQISGFVGSQIEARQFIL